MSEDGTESPPGRSRALLRRVAKAACPYQAVYHCLPRESVPVLHCLAKLFQSAATQATAGEGKQKEASGDVCD